MPLKRSNARKRQMTFLIAVVILVLIFDFLYGFRDSNSIATVVSTNALLSLTAIILPLFTIFPTKVAANTGKTVSYSRIKLSSPFSAGKGSMLYFFFNTIFASA